MSAEELDGAGLCEGDSEGEAVIIRTKKHFGLSEPCFVVYNLNGLIEIKQIKEENAKTKS